MAESNQDRLEAAGFPLSERSLLALLGEGFIGARVEAATPVGLRSRNSLLRLALVGAPLSGLILKVVRQEGDPFWEHHLRREHWLLQLLARCWPGGAPRAYAAAFGARWGVLAMEDVGQMSLARMLSDRIDGVPTGESQRRPDLVPILERVVELHAVLRKQAAIFRRVCHSVELDRMTAPSLLARIEVAHARLVGAGSGRQRRLSASTRRAYVATVAAPLLAGRRQMIHNSLSPLNIVLGPSPRFVDWETMALAAPEFDVAELLRYPDVGLSWGETERLVASIFGDDIGLRRLRLAALARAIDYAGANAQQLQREEGDAAHAARAGRRMRWYLGELEDLAAEFRLRSAVGEIIGQAPAAPD